MSDLGARIRCMPGLHWLYITLLCDWSKNNFRYPSNQSEANLELTDN